jgi:hypothetical protein
MNEMADVSLASLQVSTLEQTNATPPWSGIRALMLAVLEEAFNSLRSRHSRIRADAEFWMTSPDRRYAFSFIVICEALGLEPSAVRRSVIGLLDKKPTGRRSWPRIRPNVRHRGAIRLSRPRGKALSRADTGWGPIRVSAADVIFAHAGQA